MSLVDAFWAAPPVARSLTAGTLAISLLVHTGLMSGYRVLFWPAELFRFPPQVWRLATCFMLTGGGLAMVFDTFFIWNYSSKLETGSPRFTKPGDFFTYLVFVCVTILGLNWLFTEGMVFTPALILALVYTSAQDDRGSQVNFFIAQIPAPMAPYAMLLLTLLMAGPNAALIQGTGLLAAHLYEFLTKIWPEFGGGQNYITTPAFVTRAFSRPGPSVTERAYGTAIRPGDPSTGTSSGASTGGVLPDSWRTRGTGHRLGGD